MAQVALDIIYSLTNCLACFPSTPQLKVNDRSFKILRLLGEVSSLPCIDHILNFWVHLHMLTLFS